MKKIKELFILLALFLPFAGQSQSNPVYDDNQGDLDIRKVLILPSVPDFGDTVGLLVRQYMKDKIDNQSDDRIRFYIIDDIAITGCRDLEYLNLTRKQQDSVNYYLENARGLSRFSGRFDPPARGDFDTVMFSRIGRICNVDGLLVGTLYNYKMGQTLSTTLQMDANPELKTKGWVCFSLIDARSQRILWMDIGKHKEVSTMDFMYSTGYINHFQGTFPSLAVIVCGAFDDIAYKFPYKNREVTEEETALFEMIQPGSSGKPFIDRLNASPQLINIKDANGSTFLHYAAYIGNTELMTFLIDKGALINAKDNSGQTPLQLAVKNQKFPSAKLLFEHGADVNATDLNELTALFLAINNNDYQMTKFLVENGADIDHTDLKGATPLFFCSPDNSKTAITEYLIGKGANIFMANCYGWTPIFRACSSGSLQNAEILYKAGSPADEADTDDETPLFAAVLKNHQDVAKFLLDRQADINHRNKAGRTVLMIAIDSSFTDLAVYLVQQDNIALNLKDIAGNSALIHAVKSGNSGVTEAMLKKGADPDISSALGMTPLTYCCTIGNEKLVNLLLDFNADPDAKSANSVTPLTSAVQAGNLPIIKALVEHGANPEGISNNNMSPLILAAKDGRSEIVQYLLAKVTDVNCRYEGQTALIYAVKTDDDKSVGFLVDDPRTDMNVTDNEGNTPLMLAIDLWIYDLYGKTKKNFSELYESQDRIIEKLMSRDFNTDLKNNKGETVLMLAAEHNNNMELVSLLLLKGAKINDIDSRGYTAYDHAKKIGYKCGKIAKYLKQQGGLPGKKLK